MAAGMARSDLQNANLGQFWCLCGFAGCFKMQTDPSGNMMDAYDGGEKMSGPPTGCKRCFPTVRFSFDRPGLVMLNCPLISFIDSLLSPERNA